ncbi:MAG: hypothetical protein L6R38_006635 [Xanthoria sp. 2 TBL-2021]|nr:MAG: hypothetical protein L6R38_006635 [Xanthoria sp. 2 TBL-2021]
MAPFPKSSPKSLSLPNFTNPPDGTTLPKPKAPRRAALDKRFPTGPLKPRLVAFFTIDRPEKEAFDDGLDQIMELMKNRSDVAARTSKDHAKEYEKLDRLIREAVAGFGVKIELGPSAWIDPQYALKVVVWAFEELHKINADCKELKDILSKVVLGARDMEDQDCPLLDWTFEKPW